MISPPLPRVLGLLRREPPTLLRNPRLMRSLQRLVLVAGVGYLVALLALGFHQLGHLSWSSYLQAILLGVGLYPVSLVALGVAWALLLSALRRWRLAVSWRDVAVFLRSHLTKRLPGGVWYVGVRVAAYRDSEVSAGETIGASALEWLTTLTTAAVGYLSFGLLLFLGQSARVIFAVGATAIICAVAGAVLSRDRRPSDSRLPHADRRVVAIAAGLIGLLQLVALANGATILWLLVRAGGAELSPSQAMASWSLAAAVAAVVALVPFGIGLRDVTLAAILSTQLPAPIAVVVTVISRLLFVVGDLLWCAILLGVARLLEAHRKRFARVA